MSKRQKSYLGPSIVHEHIKMSMFMSGVHIFCVQLSAEALNNVSVGSERLREKQQTL